MSLFSDQIEALQFHLRTIAEMDTILSAEKFTHVDAEMIDMMFAQSARFAEEKLSPLATSGDVKGCILENGNVFLPEGTPEVYREWCELGFPALGLPMEFEGMDFPNIIQSGVQEVLDASNLAFGMMGINVRCAAKALLANAPEDLILRWVPGFLTGEVSSTIVISEPQAGSDVGRISTVAKPGEDNLWTISGSKIWISYGDHDATPQIIHLVLARIPSEEIGTRALGLFAVPKFLDDEISDSKRNGVSISRLEHKMGLHASPTCVLELENARGYLIGEAGKGLQALFIMMNAMRLAVGIQGSAVANMATLHALAYAKERPQGGRLDEPAIMISEHADVKRMLLEMTARSEMIRALAFKTAACLDLAEITEDTTTAEHYLHLGELLLPITKTLGAETGFDIANQGIQVLGGSGYTNDYALERMARDIRVASIYEGTSGIQALDFLKRKVIADEGKTLAVLLKTIESEVNNMNIVNSIVNELTGALSELKTTLGSLLSRASEDRKSIEPGAYHFLQLTGLVVTHWLGMKLLVSANTESAYHQRLREAITLSATSLQVQAKLLARLSLQPGSDLNL